MEILLIPLSLHLLPQILAWAMPGWRSLLILSGIYAGVCVWALTPVFSTGPREGNGLANAVGDVLGFFLGLGTIAGVTTRAGTLWLRHRNTGMPIRILGTIGGSVAPIAALVVWCFLDFVVKH